MTTHETPERLVDDMLAFVKRVVDYKQLDRISKEKNRGKRIQMCVTSCLVLDLADSFIEYCALWKQDATQTKVSRSLLTRYIYEGHVTFLYIFSAKKGVMQNRARAFYEFGEFKRNKLLRKEGYNEEGEWRKYVAKKSPWHTMAWTDISRDLR